MTPAEQIDTIIEDYYKSRPYKEHLFFNSCSENGTCMDDEEHNLVSDMEVLIGVVQQMRAAFSGFQYAASHIIGGVEVG